MTEGAVIQRGMKDGMGESIYLSILYCEHSNLSITHRVIFRVVLL